MTMFFTTVHIKDSLFFQNWNVKFQIFHALRAHIKNCCQFSAKNDQFSLKFDPVYNKKVPIFFNPTTNDPFFLHQMPPVFVLQ